MKQKLQILFNKNNPKQTLLNVAYTLFLMILVARLAKQLLANYGFDLFNVSEFLINYQGGFVRRGILGEILFFFAKHFNINVEWTVKIICLFSFIFLCIFFVRSFLKKGYALYVLPLCFFLGEAVLPGNALIRKDCLMVSFLIFNLWIYKRERMSTIIKFVLINILSIFIILTHEVSAFFSLPILFLLFIDLFKEKGVYKSIIFSGMIILPAIIAFILVVLNRGDQQTAQTIWDSWHILAGKTPGEFPFMNSINAIGWDSVWAFKFHLRLNFLAKDEGLWSVVVWAITFPLIYYIITNVLFVFRSKKDNFTEKHQTILSSIIIFQFLCLLPLFVFLSCDYIRLIFYWTATSFALFLIIPMDAFHRIFPKKATQFVSKINNYMNFLLTPTKSIVVIFMMTIGISSWSFHLVDVYHTSMLYQLMWLLSKPLSIINHFI